MELGASFSHRHLKYLGIDPLKAIKEFRALGLKWIRLGCYWDEIESKENNFSFASLDPLVEFCEKNNIKVLLTVGMKSPRYPEYYLPKWLSEKGSPRRLSKIDSNDKYLLSKTLNFISKLVEHFKFYPSIKVWQVENEPLDPSGEKWWRISPDFLEKEVETVRKLDPSRKVEINVWGNEATLLKNYKTAIELADIVGLDIYPRKPIPVADRLHSTLLTFLPFLNVIQPYSGPLVPKAKIIELAGIIKSSDKKLWIAELQAEPWEPGVLISEVETPPSFPPEQFEKNLNYVKDLEPEVIFLWGFEFWLWKKLKGDLRYWNEAKRLIKKMKIRKKTWKAISLKQPWANLVTSGKKTIETRKWKTNYRGDLVICSSQNPKIEPYGKALCIVELYHIEPMKKEHEKKACIKMYPKAYSWFLKNLRKIEPLVPVKGQLGIFDLEI